MGIAMEFRTRIFRIRIRKSLRNSDMTAMHLSPQETEYPLKTYRKYPVGYSIVPIPT